MHEPMLLLVHRKCKYQTKSIARKKFTSKGDHKNKESILTEVRDPKSFSSIVSHKIFAFTSSGEHSIRKNLRQFSTSMCKYFKQGAFIT